MATPTLVSAGQGFPTVHGSWTSNIYPNKQGDSVVVRPAAGNALIAIFLGMKNYDPFNLIHGFSANFGYTQDITSFSTRTPDVTDSKSNTWNTGLSYVLNAGADYTASLGDFSKEDEWNLDAYFPTIDVFYASSVAAGSTVVNVETDYIDGIGGGSGDYLAAGKPIWDGGINFGVLEFSGLTGAVTSSHSTGSYGSGFTHANPAIAGASIGAAGDLIISVGLMPKGNVFSAGSGMTMLASGKLVGSEAHWMVQYCIATGASDYGFSNPLGYEMSVVNYAFTHA